MISLGNVRNWLRIQKIPKASDCAVWGRISAQYVSVSPTVRGTNPKTLDLCRHAGGEVIIA